MRRLALVTVTLLAATRGWCAIPETVVDFDRSVGLVNPRDITVYPAFGDASLVYLIPNGLNVDVVSERGARAGLVHRGEATGGTLILQVTPTIDSVPLPQVVTELKSLYPKLRFATPAPLDSLFEFDGVGMQAQGFRGRRTGDPLAGSVSYSIRIPPLAVRALLIPAGYHSPMFVVSGEFHVRGVSRDDQGNPGLQTRAVRVSQVFSGFCALQPELVLNAQTGQDGCIHPRYAGSLVREIQMGIARAQSAQIVADGQFGPETEQAIRRFQRDHRLPVDGIPSLQLRAFLRPDDSPSKAAKN